MRIGFKGTRRAMPPPHRTAGTLTSIMPRVVPAVTSGLFLTGCGGDDDEEGAAPASGSPTEETAAEEPAAEEPAGDDPVVGGIVPDTTVLDLATGHNVSVRSTVAADKPTLFWFWAPH